MALGVTQAERDALAKAVKSGAQVVRYADKTVTYQSLSAMRALLADMDEELAGSQTPPRSSFARFARD